MTSCTSRPGEPSRCRSVSGDFVRGAAGTQLGLDSQDADFVQFRVTAGYVAVDLRDLPPGYTVALGTPNAALTIDHAGSYRVGVGSEVTTVVAYGGGTARVTAADGRAVRVTAGQQVAVTGTEWPSIATSAAPAPSAWDRWNDLRTDSFRAVASAPYVPPDVYGTEGLDQYGTWNVVEPYGRVWVPTAVPGGWAPYTSGRWIWDPRYGWTWLDDAAWGWAPFHYGRWVFVRGTWGWAPGPIVARPAYAPALVAFLDGPVVVGRPVCWVALGWGEPVSPWWGGPGFVGRAWWGGWGGPRIVNDVVVGRAAVVTGRDITVYRNMGVRNAVVVVPAERFARDPVARARVAQVEPVPPARRAVPLSAADRPRAGSHAREPDDVRAGALAGSLRPRGIAVAPAPATGGRPTRHERPRAVRRAGPPGPGSARRSGRASRSGSPEVRWIASQPLVAPGLGPMLGGGRAGSPRGGGRDVRDGGATADSKRRAGDADAD